MSAVKVSLLWLITVVLIICGVKLAKADDQWNSGHSDWYKAQKLNPEAQARLQVGWSSCCEHSDVVKTKFKVVRSDQEVEWYWLNENRWDKVPDDIIHWNTPTPTGEPILFVYRGTPTCFYPGDQGG